MRIFWLDGNPEAQTEITLNPDQAKWLRNVLRMQQGDTLKARSQDFLYTISLKHLSKHNVILYTENRQALSPTLPSLELWQAVPKAGRFETALRMAVEAGVSQVVPVITQFTDVKLAEENHKYPRYHRIAIEAVSQSGSLNFKQVAQPITLNDALKTLNNDDLLFFCHQEKLKEHKLSHLLADYKGRIVVLIGPEGGFSLTEIEELLQHKAYPLYLGNTILRSETAGIFVLGAIKMVLNHLV